MYKYKHNNKSLLKKLKLYYLIIYFDFIWTFSFSMFSDNREQNLKIIREQFSLSIFI